MGLSITGEGVGGVYMVLTCDGAHDQAFQIVEEFRHPGGAIEQFSAAIRRGWKESQRSDKRAFFCPSCSGKKSGKAHQEELAL